MSQRPTSQPPILVSACLLGLKTRWDGDHRCNKSLRRRLNETYTIPVCPEQLGGLPTPRTPAEIESGDGQAVIGGTGRVRDENGVDVTEAYIKGAQETLALVRLFGIRKAILKEGSPACGCRRIKRRGKDVTGMGVTAALLQKEGVQVEGAS